MFHKTFLSVVLVLLLLPLMGCKKDNGAIGTKENPLKIMYVPSDDSQGIMESSKNLIQFLEKRVSQILYGADEGFYFKASVPNSYIAVVESFGTARADLAIMNTFGYYLLREEKKFPVEAILRVMRGKGELEYKSQIIARKDSKVKSLSDLNGKKFAFTDPASTSGFVIPSAFLNKAGIDLGEVVFGIKHDAVVTMVYQGQVDAGATYYFPPAEDGKERDARVRVLTQFPDALEKVQVIGYTDAIPNAPWVLRANMYSDQEWYGKVRDAIAQAAAEYAKTPDGLERLKKEWGITGLVPTTDAEYDEAIAVFKKARELAKKYE